MDINSKNLINFLQKAHRHTYAANGKKSQSSRLNSEDFDFQEGDLIYHDTYFGNENFIGEEIVYKNEVPVWGMNYYGYIITVKNVSQEIYDFLKMALMQEYHNVIPVRGPNKFVEKGFEYKNNIDGDLSNFSGKEEIWKDGQMAYKGFYHGGLIIGKE